MKSRRYLIYASAIAVVLVLALLAGLELRDASNVAASPTPPEPTSLAGSPTPTANAASPSASATPTAVRPGAITGALGYPSNFIPPLTVYAISVSDQRVFFSVDTPRYGGDAPGGATVPPGSRPSYTIPRVAPGTYYVLAYRNDDVNREAKESPGVHSRYVIDCIRPSQQAQPTPGATCADDHSLVAVTVGAGETVSGIDVTDWYHRNSSVYPPRPTASQPGTITGELGYPGDDGLPPFAIYAISVNDPRVFFEVRTPRYTQEDWRKSWPSVPTYTITGVTPGTYHVVGYVDSPDWPALVALWSPSAATCRDVSTTQCMEDDTLLPVTVRSGEPVQGIHMWTWKPPPPNTPPRPR